LLQRGLPDAQTLAHRTMRIVLDEGLRESSDRRVRLLCHASNVRVAVWYRAQDLHRTNRFEARLQPGPTAEAEALGGTPGVTFAAGSELEVGAINDARMVEVTYDDGWLAARGWMAENAIDVVWDVTEPSEPESLEGDKVWVRSSRPLRLRALPDAEVFATLRNPHGSPLTRVARSGRWALVVTRLRGHTVVGWVADQRLGTKPPGTFSLIGKGGGGGTGRGYADQTVNLRADTLLLDERSEDALGVVWRDAWFECADECEGEQPLVWVNACGVEVRLRVHSVE